MDECGVAAAGAGVRTAWASARREPASTMSFLARVTPLERTWAGCESNRPDAVSVFPEAVAGERIRWPGAGIPAVARRPVFRGATVCDCSYQGGSARKCGAACARLGGPLHFSARVAARDRIDLGENEHVERSTAADLAFAYLLRSEIRRRWNTSAEFLVFPFCTEQHTSWRKKCRAHVRIASAGAVQRRGLIDRRSPTA
jgi:hypothetical protein